MSLQQRHVRLQKGFTLTEAAIVLGIFGLVLGAIWVAAASVYANLRVNHMNTAVLQIAQGVRGLYATQQTITSGDRTQDFISAGLIPNDLVVSTTKAKDAWGGPLFVVGTTDGAGFAIEFGGIPSTDCVNFVAKVAGAGHDAGLGLGGLTSPAAADISSAETIASVGTLIPSSGIAPTLTATGCIGTVGTLSSAIFTYNLK